MNSALEVLIHSQSEPFTLDQIIDTLTELRAKLGRGDAAVRWADNRAVRTVFTYGGNVLLADVYAPEIGD
jgi:hypothetical protein